MSATHAHVQWIATRTLRAMALLLLSLLALLFIAALLAEPRLRARRWTRAQAQPFPAHWRTILQRRVPIWRHLPADLQLQLKKLIQVFVAEKAFIGCGGQRITDEVRITIAAQACLLLLNRPNHYFPALRQILVYPGSFIVPRGHTDGMGIAHHGHAVLSGESWSQGQVVLSWQDTLEGAADPFDGHNVVIHEFAHQLDQENGGANGAPALGNSQRYAHWSAVMQAEFETLQWSAEQGEETLLNPYGATNPAEFFAVATEVFFERPHHLAYQHPALYRELSQYYRVDPRNWH